MHRPFASIPDPLVRYILTFLSPRGLSLSCSLVSKRLCAECVNAAIVVVEQLSRQHTWVHGLFSTINYEYVTGDTILTNLSNYGNHPNMIHALHMMTSPQIMLVGGNSEPRRVDSYDVFCNRWNELSETLVVREVFFEVLCHAGFIYVFCGIHHASYGMVERFNPLLNQWTSMTPLPGKLAAVVGAVLNGKIYIVGGYDWHLAKYSDAVFEMEASSDGDVSWTQLDCRMRMGRSSHACVAFQDKLWVAGGISDEGDSEGNPTVEVLDPAVGYWQQGPQLNMRRFRLRLFVVCDELYAVGGDRDERGRLIVQSIEKLHPNGQTWSHVTFFNVERRGFLSTVVGPKIYIIGGRTGEVPLTTWDCYDVTTGQWLSDDSRSNSKSSNSSCSSSSNDSNNGIVPRLSLTESDAHMCYRRPSNSPKRAKLADDSVRLSPVAASAYGCWDTQETMMCMSPSACVSDDTSRMAPSSASSTVMSALIDGVHTSSNPGCSSRYRAVISGRTVAACHAAALSPNCNVQALAMRKTLSASGRPAASSAEQLDLSSLSAAEATAEGGETGGEPPAYSSTDVARYSIEPLAQEIEMCDGVSEEDKDDPDIMEIEEQSTVDIMIHRGVLAAIPSKSDSLLCVHQYRQVPPSVTLNRLGGVVGGRAVTLPEVQLTW